jgi:hypothetical protein
MIPRTEEVRGSNPLTSTPTKALVTGPAGASRQAGAAQAHAFGQHVGSKSLDRSMS